MAVQTVSRRRDRRFRIQLIEGCRVVFERPLSDGTESARLVQISITGLGLLLDVVPPEVTAGSKLDCVTVQVGACNLRGDLWVRHVSENADGTTVGCNFSPAAHEDQLKLVSVLAGIEAVQTEIRDP